MGRGLWYGIQESMLSSGISEKDVESLKNRLIEFTRELYKELWSLYYFDYIYAWGTPKIA
jgi:hypothetical protein